MKNPDQTFPLVTYAPIQIKHGESSRTENLVCQELPLEIRINDSPYATLMRTPGLDKELAVGFCFTDGVVDAIDEIADIQCLSVSDSPYVATMTMNIPKFSGQDMNRRSLLKSSSASVNRMQILEHIQGPGSDSEQHDTCFNLSVLDDLPDKLKACQTLRTKCHSTHGAALFDQYGELLCCTEDVGRHNALDKLIGYVLLNSIKTDETILMLSSRASFEMIQKAGRIAIPVVATISAPTDLALKVAERLRCTYVSYLKQGGVYIYTHPWRFGLTGECEEYS